MDVRVLSKRRRGLVAMNGLLWAKTRRQWAGRAPFDVGSSVEGNAQDCRRIAGPSRYMYDIYTSALYRFSYWFIFRIADKLQSR